MSNISNEPGTWITLPQAAQFAARLGGVDERIAALMDAESWALEARRNINCGEWPKEIEAELKKAGDALRSLSAVFAAGRVAGEGSHVHVGPVPAQPLAPITELEWASRDVHFWRNQLQPKRPAEEFHFPPIVHVRVRTEDVRREVERELAARRSAKPTVDLRNLPYHEAQEIVRAAGAFESRDKTRKAWQAVFPERRPGPTGPRKKRAVAPA